MLSMSECTVKRCVKSVLDKLDAKGRTGNRWWLGQAALSRIARPHAGRPGSRVYYEV
jgi:hypothetical protein